MLKILFYWTFYDYARGRSGRAKVHVPPAQPSFLDQTAYTGGQMVTGQQLHAYCYILRRKCLSYCKRRHAHDSSFELVELLHDIVRSECLLTERDRLRNDAKQLELFNHGRTLSR